MSQSSAHPAHRYKISCPSVQGSAGNNRSPEVHPNPAEDRIWGNQFKGPGPAIADSRSSLTSERARSARMPKASQLSDSQSTAPEPLDRRLRHHFFPRCLITSCHHDPCPSNSTALPTFFRIAAPRLQQELNSLICLDKKKSAPTPTPCTAALPPHR